MKQLNQISSILKSINEHPLARRHKLKAYANFILWQIGGLINSGERKVAFTNKTSLLVKKGMAGATGNIYMGLHEFSDMGFLLHFLRPKDMFYDIGANIGSFSILASGHIGAKAVSFEPIPATYHALEKNIKLNNLQSQITALNMGVASKRSTLTFTSSHDTVNHVVAKNETSQPGDTLTVEVISVDEITQQHDFPILMKIDVEGFETEVINGMELTLKDGRLKAIIIELNGSGSRYGYDENIIHEKLIMAGFTAHQYEPFLRKIKALDNHGKLNTIYLRDLPFVRERLETAEPISLFSETF